MIETDALKNINIQEKSFGIEQRKLQKKIYILIPISYEGRSYEQGKKIRLSDAFIAIYCIFKYGILSK